MLVASEPKKIEGLSNVEQVECGLQYSVILAQKVFVSKQGEISVIGSSIKGALGLGDGVDKVSKMTRVESLAGVRVKKVVAGAEFNLALDENGRLFSWGYNNYGQLGNSSKFASGVPKQIQMQGGRLVKDVAAGDNFSLALMETGEVMSWGCGSSGQLGHGNTSDLNMPKILDIKEEVVNVSCGENHSA